MVGCCEKRKFLLPPFIVQSVHYKTISTTYAVKPKIIHYSVHVLQINIQTNILQSYGETYEALEIFCVDKMWNFSLCL
jgi:hypothetical protein